MMIRPLSLLFVGAILALGVSCSSTKSTNTNAAATPKKECCMEGAKEGKECCKDKAANVNATGEKTPACSAGAKECPAMKCCEEKKSNSPF
ncbi:MAG: hypothetical protein HY286_01525 [Planctomycetes bacterium]|nr:hypothetical protein [Planctomycetota bacterium]